MWKTILFDLDGTLTDSGEGIMKSAQYALLKGFGIEVKDYNELRFFVGPPLTDSFRAYANLTPEEAERAVEFYRERYTSVGIYENLVYEGIEKLLRDLKAEGFGLALTSSKPEVFCTRVLDHFGLSGYFDVICGSELDGRRVDKAEVIEEALKRLGKTELRDEVVMIGDRKFDVNGAKTAGLASIGVTWGYGSREELEESWPDCIVDTPKELSNVLIGQSRAETSENKGGSGGNKRIRIQEGPVLLRIWRIICPLLLDVGLTYIVSFVVPLALAFKTGGRFYERTGDQLVVITGIADALLLLLCSRLLFKDEKRRRALGAGYLNRKKANPLSVFRCALFGLSAGLVLSALVGFLQTADPVYRETETLLRAPGPVMQILVLGLVGPAAEELLFRGLLYRRIRDEIGFLPAVLISSLLFGVIHGNLVQGVYAALYGVLLALLYEHCGSLWACMAAHMTNNLYSVFEGLWTTSVHPAVLFAESAVFAVLALLLGRQIFFGEERINRV